MRFQKRKKNTITSEGFKKQIDEHLAAPSHIEPAWKIITKEPRLYVWRIEKFKPVFIDPAHHGEFFDGDSYIILNSYNNKENILSYDVYIWIGKHSTPDEYGTAAYKMAELDIEVLKDAAIQHREIQSNESPEFLEIFKKFYIMKGGFNSKTCETVKEKPESKLLHISAIKKNVKVQEISFRRENITDEDVFIIDLFDRVYLVNGKKCTKDEKQKGLEIFNDIKSKRKRANFEIIDNFAPGTPHPAITAVPTMNKRTLKKPKKVQREVSLWRLSDSTGKMVLSMVSKGKAEKSKLDTNDVFIVDQGDKIFVWIGKNTSKKEKFSAVCCAQQYADKYSCSTAPMIRVFEGNETEEILSILT